MSYGLTIGFRDIPYGLQVICFSNSVSCFSGVLLGFGSRWFIRLGLYNVGSRRGDRGRASVMGVEPSLEGGARCSVAENP
jgi:hypothetical protein